MIEHKIIESELYKEIEEYNNCIISNHNITFKINYYYTHPNKDPFWLTAYYSIGQESHQYDIPLDLYYMSVRDKKLDSILY